jgi:O-acetyl-ADP-ribose deacetylase (regulator of RNase III)
MKHPGFKNIQKKIAGKYGMKAAGAILASSTRKASKKAKKANPRLKRVAMPVESKAETADDRKEMKKAGVKSLMGWEKTKKEEDEDKKMMARIRKATGGKK